MSDDKEKKDLTEQVEDSKISFEDLAKISRKSSAFDRVTTIILLVICVALAAYVIFGSVGSREVATVEETADSRINVRAEQVYPETFRNFTRLNGEIGSNNSDIAIVPDTSGNVASILVKRGDMVKAGDVIAYIDPSRPGQSFKENPVTSPVDGMITSIPVSIGEQVSAASSIATVSGDKTLYIEASLPERYIGTTEVGMSADFTSVAYPGEVFNAELSFISPSVRTTNRTSDIELTITSGSEKLREGMYVTIDLVTEEQENVIAIPSSAITEALDGNIVYVVENGNASARTVTTGSRNDSDTVITSGLNAGDVVITAGTVADGSAVNVLE